MQVIELLNELLRFKSITPNDDGALNYIAMFMDEFETYNVEENGVKNLILTKRFGDVVHLCFGGHIDVVPPGDGWDSDAFSPRISDGYIYARGAQDMKSGLAAMLMAAKLSAQNTNFNGTLSLVITSDEEGEGLYGTKSALNFMAKNGFLPQFGLIGEPTCDKIFGDCIKVGRRGSINGIITIKGKQGHAAYPQKCINPAHELARVFGDFAAYNLDEGDQRFDPSKIVITDIRGGMGVCNVTPENVRIMFNVRNSPLSDENDLKRHISKVFDGIDYELDLKVSSKPFITDINSKIVRALLDVVGRQCHEVPTLSTTGGTSDARFFAEFGVAVAEFGVVNDTIHKVNERVSIEQVQKLAQIYYDLIERFNVE